MAKPAKTRGRPTLYTEALATEICDRLAAGESLRSICAGDDRFPAESTVRRWDVDDVDGFSARYARARVFQADHYADKIVDTAFKATDAGLGRLQMDALKWAASKLAPNRYGDKVAHVGGSDKDEPIKHSLVVEFVEP